MSNSKTIPIMILDDHAVVQGGLSNFMMTCDDMELVGEAVIGVQASSFVRRPNQICC
jgi:DNA-binding NarL/FixJ family response regulator